VQDIRPSPIGVFAAYADVMYDVAHVSLAGPIIFAPSYPNGQSGDTTTPGLIDEVGAFDGFSPLGGAEVTLFSVPYHATSVGTVNFTLDAADFSPVHDCLFLDATSAAPDQISFVNASLAITLPNPQLVADINISPVGGSTGDAFPGSLTV